jgi:hypothetical protein
MLTLLDRVPSHEPPGERRKPGDNGPHWRWSQVGAVTPYSEEGAVDISMAYHVPCFNARGHLLPRRSAQAR